ncbi:MAG: replication initiator protein A [Cetobacterium sp.]|uniref:replication initiator protein A n=1 Tax=Cetobacterium sp. TaxID=2071632 RepID=UPI003EE5685D
MKDRFIENEYVDHVVEETIEEDLVIDEEMITDGALVRIDMNIIQHPLFSRNTKRKINQSVKYFFNKNRDVYIQVTPAVGESIPGEYDERVFIALSKIMKKRGFPKSFIVANYEIIKEMNCEKDKNSYKKLKQSIRRLNKTNYTFKNTMYSNSARGIINREIGTNIFNIEIINLKLKANEKIRQEISDARINEVYKISMSDHFYENILSKGYLVYDSDILLKISTGTARTLYMLIEKLRFNNSALELDCIFLIKRIPLKIEKRNMNRTIEILRHNFEELKNLNLIENFEIIKGKIWANSKVRVTFSEKIIEEKQSRFFEDRNEFRKMTTALMISETENYLVPNIELQDKKELKDVVPIEKITPTKEIISNVISMMPTKTKTLKTMPKTINDAILEHGLQRVVSVAKYMKKNKVEKIRAYFLKALEENWDIDYEECSIVDFEQKKIEQVEIIAKDTEISESDIQKINEYLKSLSEIEKIKLEEVIYKDYIKKCGSEGKIQKLAFAKGKSKIIEKYIFENIDFREEVKIDLKKEEIEETEAFKLKEYILDSLKVYKTFFDFTEDELKKLHTNVFIKVTAHLVSNTLTLEITNKILEDELKKLQKDRD